MSGRSSGFLTPDSELQVHQLLARYGADGASTVWLCAKSGSDLLAATAFGLGIPCDLVSVDCLYVGIGEAGASAVDREATARMALGFPVQRLDAAAVERIHPGRYDAGLTYGDTWAMDGFGYCQGLRRALLARGVRIFEDSPVLQIQGHTLRTARGEVRFGQAVVCADRLRHKVHAAASARVYHAQTVLALSAPMSEAQVLALFPQGRFQVWDTNAVYSYYRLTSDNRLVLGGGSPTMTFARRPLRSPRVVRAVIRAFLARFPALADLKFERWWPGFIDVTRDLMPIVDADPANTQVHYVLGCPGLPWAAWAGNHAARCMVDPSTDRLDRFFGWARPDVLPGALSRLLSKPTSFAIDILRARRAAG